VEGFNESLWEEKRLDIVVRGNMAKFTQNEHLKKMLLETGKRTLVEANPLDRLWDIGLAADNPMAYSRETWQELNLLGTALEITRDKIRGAN
jgi:ribA/ribD-fused uncharacterized protein